MATRDADRKDTEAPGQPPREEIPADEARQRLGELIDRAGFLGHRVVITRHGKPIVALVSIEDLELIEAAA